MKIILTTKPNYEGASIEAGLHDGKMHFDHHGKYSNQKSPCVNTDISLITDDIECEITHIDADTFVGLRRMTCRKLPGVDLKLLEQIDLNGSSICIDKYDRTLLYAIGVGKLAIVFNFPRATEERKDVTALINMMDILSTNDIIDIGRNAQNRSELAYRSCAVYGVGDKIMFSIGADDALDPSRAYEDGYNRVVVYRKHYKSISIYCNPNSDYEYANKTVAYVKFAGHPKACGSPRGIAMALEQAKNVYKSL